MTHRIDRAFSRGGRILGALLVGLLVLLGASASAGVYRGNLYVEPVFAEGQEELARQSRIMLYEKETEKVNYLFLPSGWEEIPLVLTYPQKQMLYVDGNPVPSGEATELLKPNTQVVLTNEKGGVALRIQVMLGTGIPSVFVQTESGGMRGLDRSRANLETGGLLLYGVNGELENNEAISEMRGRGNSSYNVNFPKRAYQVRLEKSANLCGMGKAKTYNLLADYLDISLLRNRLSMDMAKQVGIPYALDSQSVNVYFNNRYNGVYLLTEKIGVNNDRLDIYDLEKATLRANGGDLGEIKSSKSMGENRELYYAYNIENEPKDITGGYILELEGPSRFIKPQSGFRTSNGACVWVKEPTQVSLEQVKFICDIFERYHRAILTKDGIDPMSGMRYDELIDTDSMALVLIMQEICKNYDHEQCSLFFFKDSDRVSTKVFAGPVWDFDRSYGNVQTGRWLNSPNNMLFQGNKLKHYLYGNAYNKQADFLARVKELYAERYLPALALLLGEREREEGDALRSLADYRAEIEPSVQMNFTYWNSFAVMQIVKYSGQSFEASYDYLVRFIENRRVAVNKSWLGE